jgi:segregation and condensation protein B
MGEGTGGLRDVIPLSDPHSQAHPTDSVNQPPSAEDTVTKSSESEAISLDDLRRAFEDAMQMSKGPALSAASPSGDAIPEPARDEMDYRRSESSAVPLTPAAILEAILFVGSPLQASLSMTALEDILHGMSASEIEKTIHELNETYHCSGHPWHIVYESGECSLQLLESIETELDRLQATPRDTALSQNSIDCLSLIAYRPGITKSELETMWGQNAGATLSYLIKKSLIRIEQQSPTDIPRYFTTARFLEILGVESLDDLPQGEEL